MASSPSPSSHKKFSPPTSPPPRVPLLPHKSTLPYPINLDQLATLGWVSLPISYSDTDPLYSAFHALFVSSAAFLGLPEEEKERYRKRDARAYQGSEEGYSRVDGEKCMITLRRADTTPEEFELKERARWAWEASARVVMDVLAAVEESLGMEEGVLARVVGPQGGMPREGEENVATLLRMFRYDRPVPSDTDGSNSKTPEPRVVAEAHRDLGLLSLVIGHTPGLECWDSASERWVACEETGRGASGSGTEQVQLTATLLVGQTLAKFTNWRYTAGRHRVFVHPAAPSASQPASSTPTSPLTDPRYRYSLVHAIRAHLPVLVSSSDFTTPITGPCPPEMQYTDVPVGKIYQAISAAHWNVNIAVEERRRQEREVQEKEKARREREGVFRDGKRSRWVRLREFLHLSKRRDGQTVY